MHCALGGLDVGLGGPFHGVGSKNVRAVCVCVRACDLSFKPSSCLSFFRSLISMEMCPIHSSSDLS